MTRTKFLSQTPGLLLLASLLLVPSAFAAPSQDGTWLDEDTNWNTPGAEIPEAPAQDGNNLANCEHTFRSASLPEDAIVEAAGWTLTGPARIYDATTVIMGMANADGMCRPFQYQVFVFTDGEFSGTLSPIVMDSRTDGSLVDYNLYREGAIDAIFNRYQPEDAQCCASRESRIFYEVETTSEGTVLVPQLPASTYDRPEYE
jgi:hypothetical protein